MILFWHFARAYFPAAAFLFCTAACSSAIGQAYSASPSADVSTSQSQQDSGSTLATTVPATGMTYEERTRLPTRELWKHPGLGISVGLNGIGLDIAEPMGQHFNVRAGGEYLKYTGNFTSDGAQIGADLKVGGGHVALDYYPWHNGFRISPQVRFGVQTEANVNVIVPSGQSISLDGGDYVSSNANPLHGTGFVDTRKTAVGLSVGYGNLSSRHGAHFSFPVEFGFYYIGQPTFAVTFTGSACDPTVPQPLGCQDVSSDAGFQSDLAKFIKRQNNNLSYASFFPIASVGVGYRF
ncbi:hypothetical protein [Terriglobus roseus]|uniref:Outer membrane protein beta-barrel domain-containing protein n=1 Tax=Terriglobus roseus TaxID=392734 RepID=A0A1H4LZD0_9BACT|nr:hypothetical protein [Terriglobus roseus]SEB75552.1 hypothetical protein SAMN05443244_1752 [Terriglobus roseus]